MNLIHLTRPDGHLVAIAPSAITGLRAPLPHEMAPGVRTVVMLGGSIQGVKETMVAVERMME